MRAGRYFGGHRRRNNTRPNSDAAPFSLLVSCFCVQVNIKISLTLFDPPVTHRCCSQILYSLLTMAQNSSIEWTDHTFNPWWGCSKVSPACNNCYAELWAKRMGHRVWGGAAARRFFSDAHWQEPRAWNEDARIARRRRRVSMPSRFPFGFKLSDK